MNRLAIIVPYYKPDFFGQALQSLAAQTDQRFRVYVGDDASPHKPEQLLEAYSSQLDIHYQRFETNLGGRSLTQQWARCIAMMRDEEWFMILGDDDELENNVVAAFYEHYSRFSSQCNVLRCRTIVIDGKGSTQSEVYEHPELEMALDAYCRKLVGATRASLSEHIFRKEAYDRHGFRNYALAWGSDDKAVIDISESKPLFTLPATVRVRMSEVSISGRSDNLQPKIRGRLDCTQDILKEYEGQMNREQQQLFTELMEHQIFRLDKISRNDARLLAHYANKFNVRPSEMQKALRRKLLKQQPWYQFAKRAYIFLKHENALAQHLRYKRAESKAQAYFEAFRKKISIASIPETIEEIVKHKKSITRFGDGELRLMLPKQDLKLQKHNERLTQILHEALHARLPHLIVALNSGLLRLDGYKKPVKEWWFGYMERHGDEVLQLIPPGHYGNANISRFYIDYEDPAHAAQTVPLLKQIWEQEDVLIVEGEFSRLGVGNDLFDNVQSLGRILCPASDAFEKYDEILDAVKTHGANKLILLALGATATALAYDLAKAGFWAVDIGHVDIEYVWMKMKASERVPIKGRFVAEANQNVDFELEHDQDSYHQSTLKKIADGV